jgi:hypothetical protein
MSRRQDNSSGNYRAFNTEVTKAFQRAMTEALESGQRRNLSSAEICVAIAVAVIHCQALAIISGDLPVSEFDGLLEEDVAGTRARLAASRASKGGS